ncbi:hypothetical protein B4135_0018 [Caldibacillus debilis]|uniref:Uncharacterized protein n=1 Tax=Caldibacillus debilis TaxID=301148 RepID=A0A150M376_9BACI|nr:hypothetical protein B4135_0018 [Caldibacillus debilis]
MLGPILSYSVAVHPLHKETVRRELGILRIYITAASGRKGTPSRAPSGSGKMKKENRGKINSPRPSQLIFAEESVTACF